MFCLHVFPDRERQISIASGQLATTADELRTQLGALQAKLEEREQRLQEMEAVRAGSRQAEAAVADLRERSARSEARCEGLERVVADRDLAIGQLETARSESARQLADLRERGATLEAQLAAERQAGAEKVAILEAAEQKLREAFKALSADALRDNNQAFLDLARTQLGEFQAGALVDLEQRQTAITELVEPIRESLTQVDSKLQELERTRAEAQGALSNQLQGLAETQKQLHVETSNLVKALRAPSVRGRWGEMQLRRVVELAGMADYCDFTEQPSEQVDDGRVRPDLVVHLPMGKHVIVDAKVPLEAYLRALEAADEPTQRALLKEHASQVRAHMTKLANKSYWEHVEHSPDHVVMFIPGEVFFFAALQHDPELIEYGVSKNVFVAGPSTLISLLRSVAYGWRQERIAENAQAISQNGRELYDRVATLAEHLRRLGNNLDKSVESYNQAVGSIETRVLVSARRFRELGAASGEEIEALQGVERSVRELSAPELRASSGAGDTDGQTAAPSTSPEGQA